MDRSLELGFEAPAQILTSQDVSGVEPSPRALCWHVLYVKSRQEKALAEELSAMGIDHYLPLERQLRFHRNRKTHVELPLFPGYLFLHGTIDEMYSADRTKRVARLIHVSDQVQIERDLCNLKLAISNGTPLRAHAYLSRGTRVEVKAGPLKGLQGIVEDSSRLDRVILQVEMLARAVSLEVDGAMVSPID
jgi:transcription antitermination factor NusG